MKREADFYTRLEQHSVQCNLCHHSCILNNNQIGLCRNKENIDGILYSRNYGKIISIHTDPIEKKPLYHYNPGSEIISVAQAGCNLQCPFCQNYEISQVDIPVSEIISVENLHNMLINQGAEQIAFTYTEPLMWYEYIKDFASSFKDIDCILITNGNINSDPAESIAPFIKAANIDLKSFSDIYYRNRLHGDLQSVKNTFEIFEKNNVHIEITFLLIENDNDDIHEFEDMVKYISNINPLTPLHISRYFPSFNYNQKPTSMDRLIRFRNIALKELKYVYLGNVPDLQYNTTYCPHCGAVLIERNLYTTNICGIEQNRCKECGNNIHIHIQ